MKYLKESGNGKTIHHAICERCEKKLERVGSMAQKYCEPCQIIVKREQSRERMKRYRERKAKEGNT